MRVGAVRKHHKGEKYKDLLSSALDKSKSTITSYFNEPILASNEVTPTTNE